MWHFIWIFTVCQSTCLGVSGSKGLKFEGLAFSSLSFGKHPSVQPILEYFKQKNFDWTAASIHATGPVVL